MHKHVVVSKPFTVLVIALFATLPWAHAAPTDAAATPVTVVKVERKQVRETVPLSGTSVPWRHAFLSPQVEGLVTRVFVEEGNWVSPGDRVITLDKEIAEIEVRIAKTRITEAQVRYDDARRQRDELRRLIDSKHVSETSLESAIAEVDAAKAAVIREQADLERREELLQRHAVYAPFAGMVVQKNVEQGQWAKTDTSLVELVAVDTIRVRVPLPQRFYPRVTVGAKATVHFDAIPDKAFEGAVFAKVASGNEATRSFPILIDIANPDHMLAPGMSARVNIELADGRTNALVVPRDRIIPKSKGERLVWKVGAEENEQIKVFPVNIQTGRAFQDRVEVISDALKEGDLIVLLGNENLRPGQPVQLQRTSSP